MDFGECAFYLYDLSDDLIRPSFFKKKPGTTIIIRGGYFLTEVCRWVEVDFYSIPETRNMVREKQEKWEEDRLMIKFGKYKGKVIDDLISLLEEDLDRNEESTSQNLDELLTAKSILSWMLWMLKDDSEEKTSDSENFKEIKEKIVQAVKLNIKLKNLVEGIKKLKLRVADWDREILKSMYVGSEISKLERKIDR